MTSFNDPDAVARYAEGPPRQVPGFIALQTMAGLLLAERVPADGHVLVLGAGGGLELQAFSRMQPSWHMLGVDPSAAMLQLAARTLQGETARIRLQEGLIDDVTDVAFDGASCLLTLHFLPAAERLHTLRQLHLRLKAQAPLVVAHHSFPQDPAGKARWLQRYAAFAAASGVPVADARRAADAISQRLPTLSPEQDAALLRQAGFEDVELFHAGFTFRGWVAYAAH